MSQQPELTPAAKAATRKCWKRQLRTWLLGKSKDTQRHYLGSARMFAKWLWGAACGHEEALRRLQAYPPGHVTSFLEAWRDHLIKSGAKIGTVNRHLSGVCSLIGKASQNGLRIAKPPSVLLPGESVSSREGPRDGDVERLIAYLERWVSCSDNRKSKLALRDLAAVRLMHGAGLRRAEVTGLDLEHVDLEHPDGPCVHPKRKGKRERSQVFLAPKTTRSLREWIEARGDEPGPVFVRMDRAAPAGELQRMTGEALRRMLARRSGGSGITKRVRPNGLRHSAATRAAQRLSLGDLKAWGGWSSMSGPSAYLDREDDAQRRSGPQVEL